VRFIDLPVFYPLWAWVAICVTLLAGGAIPAWSETIIVNEILADPASDWDGDGVVDAKLDEWIEVMNVTDAPIDLGGWFYMDQTGDTPDLQLWGVLDPGEQAVFYGSDAVAWQAANGVTTAGLSLNNTGDWAQLYRAYEGPDGPALELMFVGAYKDHEAEDDRSCGFRTDQSDWILFDALNPYGGSLEPVGTGCAPSPGAPNVCDEQVPAETASFGSVKANYR